MKKICIITGSRAEYGLLKPLMEEVNKDAQLQLQLIVTSAHLSSEFGFTYKQIESDGFIINEKVEILSGSDTPTAISKATALAIDGFSEAYEKLKPDIIVVLGDRFEIFGAAIAALFAKIPVAHIHGGEITEAAFDDSMRHCITKMSHLHFSTTEEHKKRIIQLGEYPETVFNVGALGVENIKKTKLLSKDELQKKLRFVFKKHNLLITFHPVTLENNTAEIQFQILLDSLNQLKNTYLVFTKSNADPGGRKINKMIDEYVSRNNHKSAAFTSLGQEKYFSFMQFADAVVGNSSSGIIEAPSLKIGTINIGDRQKGRTRAKSVIDCQCNKKDISTAFEMLYSKKFKSTIKTIENPYEGSETAKKIKNYIKKTDLSNIVQKKFYNLSNCS